MPTDDLRDDQSIQTAVRNLFFGSVPERKSNLSQMWLDLEPKFQLTPDAHEGENIVMDAGAYRYVRFNYRVLRAFWIAGYTAWEGSRLIAESTPLHALQLEHFNSLIAAFEKTISSDRPELEALPAGVAEPGSYADASTEPQSRAAGELATIAVAWALLHEVRHIRHQREGTGADPYGSDATEKHREEFSCDEFATTFLLEQIDQYALETNQSAELVRQKRQLGIYFGLFAVALLAKDKWGDSDTHPSLQRRLDAVRALMEPHKAVLSAAMAHAAFGTLQTVWPKAPNPY